MKTPISRRDFIKASGIAAAGAALVPPFHFRALVPSPPAAPATGKW
ncbi:MAG: hypothetical protein HW414_1355, partial [Dehalococcoidia bacterium]|nr:hypothetical protein [Dehalococcoidia bacterium]